MSAVNSQKIKLLIVYQVNSLIPRCRAGRRYITCCCKVSNVIAKADEIFSSSTRNSLHTFLKKHLVHFRLKSHINGCYHAAFDFFGEWTIVWPAPQ